ncbi:unnamed protein product [Heligmosomoides polygyrus]|uniref:Uncharacterized protein n=1 Tax=Heligmosomoides polygyrus TaxID=6339 RepID=A0A183FTY6_HELPZ|nr:unnamed protein product [Heligmosomoides polygyrus]
MYSGKEPRNAETDWLHRRRYITVRALAARSTCRQWVKKTRHDDTDTDCLFTPSTMHFVPLGRTMKNPRRIRRPRHSPSFL